MAALSRVFLAVGMVENSIRLSKCLSLDQCALYEVYQPIYYDDLQG